MKCIIYRCQNKTEMYLYIPHADDEEQLLNSLPADLLKLTGTLTRVMELELTEDRKLARANTVDVIASLKEKSWYLQMPPDALLRKDESMLNNSSDSF